MSAEIKGLVTASFEPVLTYVSKETYNKAPQIPIKVMDGETFRLIQADDLFNSINFTTTQTGALTLYRSLCQPLTSEPIIRAKQDALRELSDNESIRRDVSEFVGQVAETEANLYNYYQNNFGIGGLLMGLSDRTRYPVRQYGAYKDTRLLLQRLAKGAKKIKPESEYLNTLLGIIGDFEASDIYDFVEKPVYRTFSGLTSHKHIRALTPEFKFKPSDLKILRYLPSILMILSTKFPFADEETRKFVGTMVGMMGMYIGIFSFDFGRLFDYSMFSQPIRKKYFNDPALLQAIDSFGRVDELLSLLQYANKVDCSVVLPEIVDGNHHQFSAKELKNPSMIRVDPKYVANDVDLNRQKITFVTGPNSGGKTSLCKTIAQSQVLGQIGGFICADEASMTVADHVFYHAPMINSLQDTEGRFGVEVKRTKDLFFQTTPKSLVILDELIEATTYEERLKHSAVILNGFRRIGNNTVLVTHNHELAEDFRQKGRGQFLQVEFTGKTPTHKIIPGISTESHAEDVLERLNFTEKDIEAFLRAKGYIK